MARPSALVVVGGPRQLTRAEVAGVIDGERSRLGGSISLNISDLVT